LTPIPLHRDVLYGPPHIPRPSPVVGRALWTPTRASVPVLATHIPRPSPVV
jgi:hypothetical protein